MREVPKWKNSGSVAAVFFTTILWDSSIEGRILVKLSYPRTHLKGYFGRKFSFKYAPGKGEKYEQKHQADK